MPDRPPPAQPRTKASASRGSKPASAWDETGVDDVDIKRQVHRLCSLPGKFQRGLDDFSTPTGSTSPTVITVVPRARPTFTPGPGSLPSADTDLYEVRSWSVGMFVAWNHGVVCILVEVEFLEADGSAKG